MAALATAPHFDAYDRESVAAMFRELGIGEPHGRRFLAAIFKKGKLPEAATDELPAPARLVCLGRLAREPLTLDMDVDDDDGQATKNRWRTRDGLITESVFLRARGGRRTLCVSSQVGCRQGCVFCASGHGGLSRHLTTAEILAQVRAGVATAVREGAQLRNVVFMGMGEPLDNLHAIVPAIDRLIAGNGFHLSPRHVTVSTVGHPEPMRHLAARFPKVRIAVSLHTVDPELRRRLVPGAARFSLAQLRAAITDVARIQSQEVMLGYLLLRGVNDSVRDAKALVQWIGDRAMRVNLMRYQATGRANASFEPTTESQVTAFRDQLVAAGIRVNRRRSLGSSIEAACGQLAARKQG